ncbi:MAG: efflux RND transporter periplasmic adaptor subunit [Hyphomicrobiales bacterium]|nr:MAG: efflux RND transporter periplasmic adaptor subunit [Hyphomicrobiales bacterium]
MDIRDQKAAAVDEGPSRTSFSYGTARRLLFLAAAVTLALGSGFVFVHFVKTTAEARLASLTKEEAMAEPRVDAVTVGSPSAAQSLVLPGQTAAWNESTIYARVNGYVDKWFVDIGDHVTSGQTLATIDTPELDAEFNAAKARLKASEAQVAVKQAQADFAKTTYQRWRESPKGVVSEQEREAKKASNAEAIAEFNAAQAQVVLDQAEVARLSALVRFKQVMAPFDGTIIQRRIDIGNLVTAGSTANTTLLYQIAKDDPMRIFVDAPQSVAAQLMSVGTPVVITCDYQTNQQFEGKVTRTAEAINPASRTLRVEVDIPNPNRALVPGIYVQVSFKLKSNDLIQVPAAALLFRARSPQVAVVDEEGVVAIKDVTIARDDGNVVQIGSGLSKGAKVALNLSSQIMAGEKVKVNEIDKGDANGVAASPQ